MAWKRKPKKVGSQCEVSELGCELLITDIDSLCATSAASTGAGANVAAGADGATSSQAPRISRDLPLCTDLLALTSNESLAYLPALHLLPAELHPFVESATLGGVAGVSVLRMYVGTHPRAVLTCVIDPTPAPTDPCGTSRWSIPAGTCVTTEVVRVNQKLCLTSVARLSVYVIRYGADMPTPLHAYTCLCLCLYQLYCALLN